MSSVHSAPAEGELMGFSLSPSSEDLLLLPCRLAFLVSGVHSAVCLQPLCKMELAAGVMLGQFRTDLRRALHLFHIICSKSVTLILILLTSLH